MEPTVREQDSCLSKCSRYLGAVLFAYLCVSITLPASATSSQETGRTTGEAPKVGQPLVLNGVRVTLLSAEPLSERDRKTPHGTAPGGLRIIWLVENRPGAPLAPVLGDVRAFFRQRLYNPVTNATSSKPFAPDLMIHDPGRFFGGAGKTLRQFAPTPRAGAVSIILEAYLRGDLIPSGAPGIVEIELGDSTARPGTTVQYQWFRFRLPAFGPP